MRNFRLWRVCLFLAVELASATAQGQQKPLSKPAKQKPKTTANTPPPTPPEENLAKFEAKLPSLLSNARLEGDYIPCEFSVADLMALRPDSITPPFTSSDEERFKAAVIAAAASQANIFN